MNVEMVLMFVEVIYLWRALPFCGQEVKRQLFDKLNQPLPAEAQPVHHAMRAWLKGGILNSLNQPVEAEKVGREGLTVSDICHCYVFTKNVVVFSTHPLNLQCLREALRYDGAIKNDKHILSFSLYELAMIQINRDEVSSTRG